MVGKSAGKTAGRIGGGLVQPAVWACTGTKPDAIAPGFWGAGLTGIIGAVAAGVTGIVKGMVDDHVAKLLIPIRNAEPAQQRPFVVPTTKYSNLAGQYLNALTIASKGGTAWMRKNGLCVSITDAKGRLVPDDTPNSDRKLFQPTFPLRKRSDGYE